MITEKLGTLLKEALGEEPVATSDLIFEHPADSAHGDYSTNAALVLGKKQGINPKEFAEKLAQKMREKKPPEVDRIDVAGPGFINFYLSHGYFSKMLAEILSLRTLWGRNDKLLGKKIMVEYTDPNPFKEFHIGHLMTNTIGEAVSRLLEVSGAEVKRANYQGDLGLHVAKAVWAMREIRHKMPPEEAPLKEKVAFLGECYVYGAGEYEENPEAARAIREVNALLYSREDKELDVLYEIGKRWSLEHFEDIYEVLGTKFDYYIFESETGPIGMELVEKGLSEGVFEESDGAVVFRGEKYGLHTRVFRTSQGLPTYEAKELGLAKMKYDQYPFDISVSITANEINAYFEVVLKALSFLLPDIAQRIRHVGHGFMRLSGGKMSSRKGNVVTGESLIEEMTLRVDKRTEGRVELKEEEKEGVGSMVAVSAIKYSILKQAAGRDIVFDIDQSLSLEGDSGPYLQYSTVRAYSVLQKAKEGKVGSEPGAWVRDAAMLVRLMNRFPEIVERSARDYSPHHVAQYLTELAGEFNSWYAKEQILDGKPEEKSKIAITEAFLETMKNGLWILGIQVPEKM